MIFIGVPIIVVTIAYLIGLFTNHRGNLSDFCTSPLAVVLLIVGGSPSVPFVYPCRTALFSAIIANNVYFYFWDIYGSRRALATPRDAYSERLAAKTYADQLFLGQQEFSLAQFRENMVHGGYSGD